MTEATKILDELKAKLEGEFENSLQELSNIVSIPSVSSLREHDKDLERSAENVVRLAKFAGFEDVKVIHEKNDGDDPNLPEYGQPAVIAQKTVDPAYPTVLLYAHHDVQPAIPQRWKTPPFEARIEGDTMYGRGAADDGAGIIAHISALRIIGDNLPVNIKLFVEGEEEIGSASMSNILKNHADDLDADVIFLADSGNWAIGTPGITQTLRGVMTVDIELAAVKQPLHSGMFSGPIMDPIMAMCRLFSTLHDEAGNLVVEGLKEDEEPIIDYTEEQVRADAEVLDGVELIGSGKLTGRLWTKPTCTVIGFDATSTERSSNTITDKTKATLSFRLAPTQNLDEAKAAVKKHLEANIPFGLHYNITFADAGLGFSADFSTHHAGKTIEAFSIAWGKDVVKMGLGGSIPFATEYKNQYPNATVLVTGVESPDSHAHGDNETVCISDLKKAILGEALALYGIGGRF
jgi:acetylornithine deacetylase/succinyl-diaminopimelate desuccinylase-like protein